MDAATMLRANELHEGRSALVPLSGTGRRFPGPAAAFRAGVPLSRFACSDPGQTKTGQTEAGRLTVAG
jgi:hypothetical protein